MKTQELYNVAVTENEYVRDAETNMVISTRKRVIYSKSNLPAFSEANAGVQATLAAGRITGDKAIRDEAEVEVKVNCPFC